MIQPIGFSIGSELFKIALKTKEFVEDIGGKAELEPLENNKLVLNIIK